MIEFDLVLEGTQAFDLEVGVATADAELAAPIVVRKFDNPPYEGDYEVTPGEDAVTLQTQGLSMYHDVKINPIPSNYGRLTYSGGILRVW